MPRAGSVWLDAVCRVPKETSFWMVAWMRAGSIWWIRCRKSGSGFWLRLAVVVAAARALPVRRKGTAAAVTADADRNARRVEPEPPADCWVAMINNHQRKLFGVNS